MVNNSLGSRPKPFSTRLTLVLVLVMRTVIDTGTKLFFPYLSIIAVGLGTTPVELGRLLSWRDLTGLVAPFLGNIADKRGYRPVVSASLLLSAIGFLTVFFSQSQTGFVIGILLGALGSTAANPNIIAYLSHRLPWDKRSQGLGIVEYAWGLASIIGVAASGYLITLTSWRAPFLIVGILLIAFAILFYQFPTVKRERSTEGSSPQTMGLWKRIIEFFDLGANWRSAVATHFGDTFTRFAGFLLFINYGTWLSTQFGLNAAGLATAVFWLGFSDICGSVLVSVLGDRVGKRRSVIGGTLLGAIFFALLPFWQGALATVIIGIFLARAMFEFSIVSFLVLASEQTPEHRGKMMTQKIAFSLIATFLATRFGPQIFEAYAVAGFAWMGAVSLLIAALITIFFIKPIQSA